jgi:hypothetical protein
MTCPACRRPSRSFFEITRFDVDGVRRGAVQVCSLPCVIRWAYGQAATSTAMIASRIGSTVDEIMAALTGNRRL